MSGSSVNDSKQVARNAPLSAIAETSRGTGANPDTDTVWGANKSLLRIVSVAPAGPGAVGRNRITISSDPPGSIASG